MSLTRKDIFHFMTSYELALALAAWTQHFKFYKLLKLGFVITVAVFSEFYL